jgi:hypothetical protein
LRGILNVDGKLTQARGASSFQQSCEGVSIELAGQSVILFAKCLRIDGAPADSRLRLDGIENVDGVLRYAMPL